MGQDQWSSALLSGGESLSVKLTDSVSFREAVSGGPERESPGQKVYRVRNGNSPAGRLVSRDSVSFGARGGGD